MSFSQTSEALDDTAPNIAERIKRKNFYLNNGFEDLQTKVQERDKFYGFIVKQNSKIDRTIYYSVTV